MNKSGERTWEALSLYESKDLVRQKYWERHKSSLKAHKAEEIVAYFAQGHEYFRSAAGASELVRPLLLYYGCVSLARGLILFLDQNAALKPTHGLGTQAWQSKLSTTMRNTPDLQVDIQSGGTLPELLKATKNEEENYIPAEVVPNSIPSVYQGTDPVPQGTKLTLKEILGQIPDLTQIFESTFGEHSACLMGDVQAHNMETGEGNDNSANIAVFESSLGVPDPTDVANRLGQPHIAKRPIEDYHHFAQKASDRGRTHYFFPMPYKRAKQKEPERDTALGLPVTVSRRSDDIFIRLPTSAGITLATLPALHLAAYAVGMLVRYHPNYWMAVISRATGDYVAPILSAAASVIEEQYPSLVLEKL